VLPIEALNACLPLSDGHEWPLSRRRERRATD
jgi:hypothetical protein